MKEKIRSSHGRVPGLIRRDFVRKAVAVFLAVLLYYYVHDQIGTESPYNRIPVTIEVPGDMYYQPGNVPTVTVVVKGSAAGVGELSAADIHIRATVNPQDYRPGQPYVLKLSPTNVKVPSGVRVVRLEPQELLLDHLEMMRLERVPVAAEWNYQSSQNIQAYWLTAQFLPERVTISGPESLVRTIREARTEPIEVDLRAPGNFTRTVGIAVPPGVTVTPGEVEAQIRVEQRYLPRNFPEVPVMVLDAGVHAGRRVEFVDGSQVEVEVTGPPSQVMLLSGAQLLPYVDVSRIGEPGEYTLPVECRTMDELDCRVTRIFPGKIKVKLSAP